MEVYSSTPFSVLYNLVMVIRVKPGIGTRRNGWSTFPNALIYTSV